MDRNWWLLTFFHQRCPMLSPAPACLLGSWWGLCSKSPQPCFRLCSSSTPLSHAASSVRQHQAHEAVTDTVFELQVCADSTGELLLLLTQGRHRGIAQVSGGEERQLPAFPPCVHSTHGSNMHTMLPYFALLSASTASSLLSPPKSRFNSRQAQPPAPTTQNLICFGQDGCQWSCVYPPAQAIHPKRHPVKTFTCKLTLVVSSTLHFNQSQQAINTTHPWGLEVTTASWGKKNLWKKSEGWINWACSCLLYIWDVTKFMLLHRIFFLQGMSRRKQCKNQNKVFTLLIDDCAFTPQATMSFARLGTWTLWCILCKKFCNSVYYNEKNFPFILFV